VLFGDAAAAAIVTRSDEGETSAIHHARFETHSSGAEATQILGGGTLHLPNDPTTTPEMNQFSMNGRAVFRQAGRSFRHFSTASSRRPLDARERARSFHIRRAGTPSTS
jgi:3-oxoacyl-[acyl-carrier-protein] synthase-3